MDVTTVYRAAVRHARARSTSQWPSDWYRTLMEGRLPPPVRCSNRWDAVEIHQLRAGHWSGSAQYLHRIGRLPSPQCAQCNGARRDARPPRCEAGWCRACGEEVDTPDHVLLRCPALMVTRHRLFGTIFPAMSDVRRDDVLAAMAAVARHLQSR